MSRLELLLKNPRRKNYAHRFGIKTEKKLVGLTQGFMDQLDMCRSDAARRLLLGIGRRKESALEQPATQ